MDEKRTKRITNILLEKHNIDLDDIEKTPQFISLMNVFLTTGKTPTKDKLIRYCCIVAKLKLRNLKLRGDSVLCENYINGKKDVDLDTIVDIMDEMNWFYNHSTYQHHMSELYDINLYDSDYHERKYNNYDMSDMAKDYAIQDWMQHMKKPNPPLSLKNIIAKKLLSKISVDFTSFDILNKFYDDKNTYNYSCNLAEKYDPWLSELEIYKYINDDMNEFVHNKLYHYVLLKIKHNDIAFIDKIDNYVLDLKDKIMNVYDKYKDFIFCKNNKCFEKRELDKDICDKCHEILCNTLTSKCTKCQKNEYGKHCKQKCCRNCCDCEYHLRNKKH